MCRKNGLVRVPLASCFIAIAKNFNVLIDVVI